MTPAARIATAIEILDRVIAGEAAEAALTGWARGHRFAGSSDRAAIRDHVYDALRCWRSLAALGGAAPDGGVWPARKSRPGQRAAAALAAGPRQAAGPGLEPGQVAGPGGKSGPAGEPVAPSGPGGAATGRRLMIGALRAAGSDLSEFFTGAGFAPAPLDAAEAALAAQPLPADLPELVALDCPDWAAAPLRADLGADFAPILRAMRQRAGVFLRVNLRRCSLEEARQSLAAEAIGTLPNPLAATALEVTGNPQRIRASAAYRDGLVELQDAASQAAVALLPLADGARVLDYCAGGGGKTLAMAGLADARFFAHDAQPARMRDFGPRAARAGITVRVLGAEALAREAPFDLVLVDAPCSGSGTWRRTPEAKWTLSAARLADFTGLQHRILARAQALVGPGGHLGYMTCSLFAAENVEKVREFLAETPGWRLLSERRFSPLEGGDGFYAAVLQRL